MFALLRSNELHKCRCYAHPADVVAEIEGRPPHPHGDDGLPPPPLDDDDGDNTSSSSNDNNNNTASDTSETVLWIKMLLPEMPLFLLATCISLCRALVN